VAEMNRFTNGHITVDVDYGLLFVSTSRRKFAETLMLSGKTITMEERWELPQWEQDAASENRISLFESKGGNGWVNLEKNRLALNCKVFLR
jgi:hypothetical protein